MKTVLLTIALLFSINNVLAKDISVQDRLMINETIASYGHTFDRRDGVKFAALFTENGRWDAFPNKAKKAVISLQGRKQIGEFANSRQQMFADAGVETKHFMLDVVVTKQSENEVHTSAMAIIMWQRPLHGDPLPRPVQTGYYDFVLHKVDGGWKLHQVNVLTSGYYKPAEIYKSLK